ncbi:MAG: hypothetical protein AABZ67_00545 [Pseudomonadota bacterium]
MKPWQRLLVATAILCAGIVGALAQTNPGVVTNRSVLISPGPGVVGYRGAAPGTAGWCLTSNGGASDPSFQVCGSGADVTGVTISSTDGTLSVGGSPCVSGNCAFDLGPLGANSVSTTNIQAAAVTQAKVATDAITTTGIIDAAVTYAKIQDVTASRLLGRGTASSGPPQEITLGAGLAISGTTITSTEGTLTGVTISSTNATLSIGGSPCTSGACAFTADVAAPLTVPYGGTGQIANTNHAVLLGQGASAISSTGPGTAGKPLVSLGASVDPDFLTLGLSGGGTANTTAAGARSSAGLNIDQMTTLGDVNYQILPTDRTVITSVALTPTRTWTLAAANSVNAGQSVCIYDSAGVLTTSAPLAIAVTGGDTINGSSSNQTISTAFASVCYTSNGATRWALGISPIRFGGTGQTSFIDRSVLLGNGAAAISSTGPGATGEFFMGLTGLDPYFTPITTTQGAVIYRDASTWTALAPGTNGQVLTTAGAGANPSWTTAAGSGTVTSVAAGTGLTASPSPIVATGTISMSDMAQTTIKGRASGAGTGAPADLTATQAAAIIATVGGATKNKISFATRDLTTASGTQAVTGVGFAPAVCVFFDGVSSNVGGFGASDVTTNISLTIGDAGAGLTQASASYAIKVGTSTTAYQTATVQSMDADGFTLNWTKTSTPTGTAVVAYWCTR